MTITQEVELNLRLVLVCPIMARHQLLFTENSLRQNSADVITFSHLMKFCL